MSNAIDFTKRTFCLITGASQGIGQTIAIELARKLTEKSVLILLARSEKGLGETRGKIQEINKNIKVVVVPIDLTHPKIEEFDNIIDVSLKGIQKNDIDLGLIVHNVGQVGLMQNALESSDITVWREYFDLNVFSVSVLNSVFVKKLREFVNKIAVINISSLCGRKPFKNMALYGSGKSARSMYFKVLAEEESDLIVFNYSPGPVETPMIDEVIKNIPDSEMRSMFTGLRETKKILTTEETVGRLLGILEKGEFKSGDEIDYYDIK